MSHLQTKQFFSAYVPGGKANKSTFATGFVCVSLWMA